MGYVTILLGVVAVVFMVLWLVARGKLAPCELKLTKEQELRAEFKTAYDVERETWKVEKLNLKDACAVDRVRLEEAHNRYVDEIEAGHSVIVDSFELTISTKDTEIAKLQKAIQEQVNIGGADEEVISTVTDTAVVDSVLSNGRVD